MLLIHHQACSQCEWTDRCWHQLPWGEHLPCSLIGSYKHQPIHPRSLFYIFNTPYTSVIPCSHHQSYNNLRGSSKILKKTQLSTRLGRQHKFRRYLELKPMFQRTLRRSFWDPVNVTYSRLPLKYIPTLLSSLFPKLPWRAQGMLGAASWVTGVYLPDNIPLLLFETNKNEYMGPRGQPRGAPAYWLQVQTWVQIQALTCHFGDLRSIMELP